MIDSLKPYPEYGHTDCPWLGALPHHWEARRLKVIARNVVEQTSVMTDGDVYIALENVESWTGRTRPQRGASLFIGEVKRFMPEDVLFGKLRPYLAKVTRQTRAGVCVGEFFVLRSTTAELQSAYLERLLRSHPIVDVVNSSTFGAKMPRADWQFVGNLTVCLPPPNEQRAIVQLLNWADKRVDRAIRVKKQLIGLLEEQKQNIVHRAVTCGLDPTVTLKPSGREWLGDIPEHWSIQRAKTLFRLRTQKSGNHHGLELLALYTHIGVRPRKELEQRGNKASTTNDYWIVRKGDIIVNKLLAWMGAVGVSNYDGVTSPAYDILGPIGKVIPEFYHYLFRTTLYLQQFKQRSRGIMDMRLRLYFNQLGQIPLLVPPLEEQSAIVTFCTRATVDLDRAIERVHREISLLREYRTRLVADVVTGKLDVRDVEVPATEPNAEVEPLIDDTESQTDDEEPVEEYANADD